LDFGDVHNWISTFSYPAVFLLLLAAGMGMPISEDVVLVAGGVAAGQTGVSLGWMMLCAWVGVVCGDYILFRIGRRFGHRALNQRWVRKAATPRRVAWVTSHFDKYGVLTVFMARFTIGLRVVTFVSAGVSGIRSAKFLAADAAAAAIFVPALVWLGFRFGNAILADVESTLAWVLGAVLTVLAVGVVSAAIRRRRALKRQLAAGRALPSGLVRRVEESA
jgi:membrane-associated protein